MQNTGGKIIMLKINFDPGAVHTSSAGNAHKRNKEKVVSITHQQTQPIKKCFKLEKIKKGKYNKYLNKK